MTFPENQSVLSGTEEGHPGRYAVGDLLFSRVNRANIVEAVESFFSSYPKNNYVCVSNVHVTVECRGNLRLRGIQNGSFLTIADGQPVIFYGKANGEKGIERIMGPDLMSEIFGHQVAGARRHFFLGGTPETLAKMETNLKRRFPSLCIAGSYSPPFRALDESESAAMIKLIGDAEPDYLWVCFGAPKQEYWMSENHRLLPKSLLIGIGAGFAYHAGELKRAPLLAQRLAFEWVWRLAQDPRRLWKRYLSTNPRFLLMLAATVAGRALGGKRPGANRIKYGVEA
jgi:N-acetylglucosaminyldiphosphoundecaprenol N-acetyl-beta-D-mannosaminyltransferase